MRASFKSTIALSALSVWLFSPLSALSNDSDSLAKFMACAEIENPPLRYACFDETAMAVKTMQKENAGSSVPEENFSDPSAMESPASNEIVTAEETSTPTRNAPAEASEDDKGGLFGFMSGLTRQAKTPEEFGLEEEPEESDIITEITGNITDFRISGTGRITVLLDNGQIWQQISGDSTSIRERIMARQTSANIETAAMGTYLMRLSPSGQSIRVRRIQ